MLLTLNAGINLPVRSKTVATLPNRSEGFAVVECSHVAKSAQTPTPDGNGFVALCILFLIVAQLFS